VTRFRLAVAACLAGATAWGCDARPEADLSRPADFGFQVPVGTTLVEEGRVAYEKYCVGCHGVTGDGVGDAYSFLHPKPRNFQLANFKFSSTRSGQLPTDDDLRRSIRNGLRGSAMPEFRWLPDRTIDSLIAYIKTFSDKWEQRGPGQPIPIVEDPYRRMEDKTPAIERGEMVYHGMAGCWNCHPAYVPPEKISEQLVALGGQPRSTFRDHLDQAVGKANAEGELIYPPDFHRDFVRAGMRAEDLYRSIAAGITGTAMPTWVDSIEIPGIEPDDPPLTTRADLWAMAYYVQHLIAQRPARLTEAQAVVRDRVYEINLDGASAPATSVEPASTETPPAAEDDWGDDDWGDEADNGAASDDDWDD